MQQDYCVRLNETSGGNSTCTDGIYFVDPSGGKDSHQVFCDMTNDDGGWTLLITMAADGLAKPTPQAWPNLQVPSKSLLDVANTGMYKGAFHSSYSEVREELAAGLLKLYGDKLSSSDLDLIRNQYGYSSRTAVGNLFSRPSCRFDYNDRQGSTVIPGCAVDVQNEAENGILAADSLVVGWAFQPRGFEECFFAAGSQKSQKFKGSYKCPGRPDGSLWSRVWFR